MKSLNEDEYGNSPTESLTLEEILAIIEEAAGAEDLDNPYVPLNFNDED